MLLIVLIVWIVYSLLEGFREGYYWYYKSRGDDSNKYEIHPIFASQRALVLINAGLLVFISLYKCMGLLKWLALIKAGMFVLCLMLIFSFIHNGMYYTTRNILNKSIYNLKWKAQSTTSTAKWTKFLTFRNRTIMFGVGLIGILLIIII